MSIDIVSFLIHLLLPWPRPTHLLLSSSPPETGVEPVRVWLKELPVEERKLIGEDIKTVQYRWPLGMPLVRHLGSGL